MHHWLLSKHRASGVLCVILNMCYWFLAMTEKKEISSTANDIQEHHHPVPRSSRGALFGLILLVIIFLLGAGIITMVAWGGYRGYHVSQERSALPSITMLSVSEDTGEMADKSTENATEEEKSPTDALVKDEGIKKARATAIKVLNGGAAKGSASALAEVLKKGEYTKVTLGNTIKDYVGVVVYFAPEAEKEAHVVKNDLQVTYPLVETKPAIANNPETTQAPLSVIIGK